MSFIIWSGSNITFLNGVAALLFTDNSGSTGTRMGLQTDNNWIFRIADESGSAQPMMSVFAQVPLGSRNLSINNLNSISPTNSNVDLGNFSSRWRSGSFNNLVVYTAGTFISGSNLTFQSGSIRLNPLFADPSSPTDGEMWYFSSGSTKQLRFRSGSTTVQIQFAGI